MSFAESDKLRNPGRPATKAFALLCAVLLCTVLALGMGGCTSEEEEEEEDDYDYTSTYSQYDYDSGSEDEDEEDEAEGIEDEDEETIDRSNVESEEEEDVAALAETTLNEDGIPISESMPYVGMDAKFIDVTWMGEHDGEEDVVEGGLKEGSVPYYWLADNDTGDKVFTAYVRDGEVIAVYKNNPSLDYWYDPDSTLTLDYPDMDAAGDRPEDDDDDDADYPDPSDYDSADDYADNAEGDFEAAGSDDPWNDAYDYWWDNY